MDNNTFYQIASMASIMAELAKEGEELSNAIGSTHQNIAFMQNQGRTTEFFESEAVRLISAKEKIEIKLKAKNKALQKMFNDNKSYFNYWKERCLLVERAEELNPCDNDITSEQIQAWSDYREFIKQHGMFK